MAKTPTPDLVRSRMSNELLELSNLLGKFASDTVINADVLRSAANAVLRGNKSLWAYELHGLQLRVDVPQNTLPAACPGPLLLDLNFEIEGTFQFNDGVEFVTKLILELAIRSGSGEHLCAWHFDRHIGDGDAPPTEAHPLFHFQHGGHAMKPYADFLGSSLLLPTPRLAFPPMDATLAIDFVLSNFSGTSWNGLRDEAVYCRLLRDAQLRYWRPYVLRLAEWWGPQGTKPTEKILALWPQLT